MLLKLWNFYIKNYKIRSKIPSKIDQENPSFPFTQIIA